jgi:ornithine carbamoyltransferase
MTTTTTNGHRGARATAKSDLLSFEGMTGRDVLDLFAFTDQLKDFRRTGRIYQPLIGMSVAMLFEKPSLRTRASFEVGIHQLGGYAMPLPNETVGIGTREAVCDIAWLLSRYNDAIIARTFSHDTVEELAAAASIPVVNALTDKLHPCQILADAYTMHERGLMHEGVRVAFIGDGNNVAQSWIELTRLLPIDLVIACPEGYDPDSAIVAASGVNAAGKVTIVRDPREAAAGAHVVYTDVWTSMGQETEYRQRLQAFTGFMVTQELMSLAAPNAVAMHCLPAHRGEEIAAEVIDGPQSVVWDEAENRLHMQKAILVKLLNPVLYTDFHLTRRLKRAALSHGA